MNYDPSSYRVIPSLILEGMAMSHEAASVGMYYDEDKPALAVVHLLPEHEDAARAFAAQLNSSVPPLPATVDAKWDNGCIWPGCKNESVHDGACECYLLGVHHAEEKLEPEVARLTAALSAATHSLAQREREAWVSVKDRLPESDGFYLVHGNCTGEDEPSIDIAGFHVDVPMFAKYQQPTHWQPLPTPPIASLGLDLNPQE